MEVGVANFRGVGFKSAIGRPQRVIVVANFRRVGFASAIERLQSVTGVTNFRGIRQWKAPKRDRGREF